MLDIGQCDHKAGGECATEERGELYGSGQSGDQEKHWSCVHKINSNQFTTFSILFVGGRCQGVTGFLELKR